MNTSIKMMLVLTLITMLSGGVLAYWDAFTQPRILYHREQALKKAVAEVLPTYENYEQVVADGMTFYIGKVGDKIVGVAFQADGSGFQGNILMMVGVTPEFAEITGIIVLEQVETPGLGTKIVTDPTNKSKPLWFREQFKGVAADAEITVVKNIAPANNSEIQAITGATITSKAIVRIVSQYTNLAKTKYQSSSNFPKP